MFITIDLNYRKNSFEKTFIMNTLKKKTKHLLKNSPYTFTLIKVLWRFFNLSYLILLIRYILHKIKITKCLFFKKKITRDYFLGASTSKKRVKELKILLDQQITRYQKSKDKKKFTLIEVGVFLGQTTEELGKLLKKKLKNNFEIITIDPFIPYTNLSFYDFVIPNVYKYFLHNMKICNLNDKIFHIRMKSIEAFKILKKNKKKYDFCFIDGSHKYNDVLHDVKNFNKFSKKKLGYKGILVGDDFEYSYSELINKKKIDKNKLKKIKKDYINFDSTISLQGLVFHPGVTFALNDLGVKVNKSKNGIWSIV